jgi:hypothetical protein
MSAIKYFSLGVQVRVRRGRGLVIEALFKKFFVIEISSNGCATVIFPATKAMKRFLCRRGRIKLNEDLK